jgi:isoquinoline 1-oxidoreductase subunit alpha
MFDRPRPHQHEQEAHVQLTVNGRAYAVSDTEPSRLLLWVLRDELGFTGTKFGCGAGICGACTVHVDGVATRSCVTPLSTVQGAQLRTIEGLAHTTPDGRLTLHPVQQAFLDEQVAQCAWCMSGQMMTATAYLDRHPDPTPDDVVEAMSRNYCRCGCYPRIKRAVIRAADLLSQERDQ